MIGIGLDLVRVDDWRSALAVPEATGTAAEEDAFRPAELAYCRGLAVPDRSFAARVAAKRAAFRALGVPVGTLADVEILRAESGAPSLELHGEARRRADELGARRLFVSMTHTDSHAAATVVVD